MNPLIRSEKRFFLTICIITVILIIIISKAFLKGGNTLDLDKYPDTSITSLKPADFIEITHVTTKELSLPTLADGKFKTFMDYRTITATYSKQWELQQDAWTDGRGFRRLGDYYMVAVGTYYAKEVGKELLIKFEDGIEIKAIVGDIKQDRHTDKNNQFVPINGNIVEFIVDTDVLPKEVIRLGDVSWLGLNGKIVSIKEVETSVRQISVNQ